MALYAIGDIQGCLDPLEALLTRINFDPQRDRLWFTGDLVNRGPRSADTLRFVKGLGSSALTVLGNHDLHLLAARAGATTSGDKDTLDDVLDAPDCDELLDWLTQQPLLHFDSQLQLLLVHAGLHPAWSIEQALSLAAEAEQSLRETPEEFFSTMYGNRPRRWRTSLTGADRIRFITNVFTRMRYVDDQARLRLKFKGAPGNQPDGQVPWFDAPDRVAWPARIVFGHWSSLGVIDRDPIISLDSGCLWGRALTAVRLDPGPREMFSVNCPPYG